MFTALLRMEGSSGAFPYSVLIIGIVIQHYKAPKLIVLFNTS
jgi:hypothetical protein